MNTNRIVVLHATNSDPVAMALRTVEGAVCIHVDSLAPYLERGDWREPLRGDFPDEILKTFDGADIINRNFSYDGTDLAGHLAQWGLHTLWVDSALSKLVSRGRSHWHDMSIRGISRSLLPLNSQWFLLAGKVAGVSFPKFVYGFGKVQPSLDGFHDPLQKSVWSLFDWRSESKLSESDSSWHQFFVDRPAGIPVVISYVGMSVSFVFPRGHVELDAGMRIRCAELAQEASRVFASSMGEILAYIQEDGTLVFCAFSPIMLTSSRCSWFEDFLVAGLTAFRAGTDNVPGVPHHGGGQLEDVRFDKVM